MNCRIGYFRHIEIYMLSMASCINWGSYVSRSSISFGIRIKRLYLLSVLQFANVVITVYQSVHDKPFSSVWLLLALIFYEGLLGGFLYVNTFMSVSEEVSKSKREFSMGCVGISDMLWYITCWMY